MTPRFACPDARILLMYPLCDRSPDPLRIITTHGTFLLHHGILKGMNEKVLRAVEYSKIIEQLTTHATSEPGKKLCRALEPMRDLHDIDQAQSQTESALNFLFRNGSSVNFGNTRDFTGAIHALAIGTSLSIPEFLHLAAFLENIARVKAQGPEDENDPLFDLFDCLYPLTPVSQEIRRCILAEDLIADDASPALKKIRRDLELTDDRIHAQLNKMATQTYASYLQDNVITMRDDRYCLPVRAEYKAQVKGIVHDSSSTGSTLFIEPTQIVELGNRVRELHVDEQKEVERILAALSALAADHTTELKDDQINMAQLDFIFAKASLALEQNATRPVFNDKHVIRIHRGRHPLIDKKKVVPIDVTIGEDYNMIIVTGPNTGGKTVTLKTVGLFELMGMAGLHIPAGDKSELSIFREVFADIGDEQSIEQNLSTFSAHMTSIVDILKRADSGCLCLFDELGSGTDPTEGAALAISILNFMHVRGITTLATTHYAELKVYAMRTEGIVNASCEFDIETLQPTYKLLVGVPGKSNAFAISQKLGLPGYIIETAREQLSQETQNFEDVLAELEDTRRAAQKAKEDADRRIAELSRREKILIDKENKIEEKKQKILDKANEEARDILQDAKRTADQAISAVRKSTKGVDMDALEQQRTALREKASARAGAIKGNSLGQNGKYIGKQEKLRPDDLHLGDMVRVLSMNMTGTVETLPDKQGRLTVRCGILNSKVSLDEIALVDEETGMTMSARDVHKKKGSSVKRAFANPNAGNSSGAQMDFSRSMRISPEINLLGMTTDEAIMALDKYLDDARMSHLESVRVVHGKGTGALRNAVQNYLRKQKWVHSYRAGDFGEGDAGVTIVTL